MEDADIDWEFFVDDGDGYFDVDVFDHFLDLAYPEVRATVSGIPNHQTHLTHLHSIHSRSTHSILSRSQSH